MKKLLLLILVLTPLLPLTLFAESHSQPLAESGEKIFVARCASCHGQDARGQGPASLALRKTAPNLRQISKRRNGNFPTTEVMDVIDGRSMPSSHGNREMPVWGRVFSQNAGGGSLGEEVAGGTLAALVEFLRSIQE